MNFANLQNQVQILLGDTSGNFFTTDEVKDQINRAVEPLAAELEYFLTFCDYTTTSGTQRYTLEEDYQTFKSAKLIVDTDRTEPLKYATLDEFDDLAYADSNDTGEPVYIKIEYGATSVTNTTQRPGDFWLFPTPDTNGGSNYTVRLYYYRKAALLSNDTDVPDFPPFLHQAIAYSAAKNLALKNGDLRLYRLMDEEYRKLVFLGEKRLHRNQRNRPIHTRDVMGYTIGDLDSL